MTQTGAGGGSAVRLSPAPNAGAGDHASASSVSPPPDLSAPAVLPPPQHRHRRIPTLPPRPVQADPPLSMMARPRRRRPCWRRPDHVEPPLPETGEATTSPAVGEVPLMGTPMPATTAPCSLWQHQPAPRSPGGDGSRPVRPTPGSASSKVTLAFVVDPLDVFLVDPSGPRDDGRQTNRSSSSPRPSSTLSPNAAPFQSGGVRQGAPRIVARRTMTLATPMWKRHRPSTQAPTSTLFFVSRRRRGCRHCLRESGRAPSSLLTLVAEQPVRHAQAVGASAIGHARDSFMDFLTVARKRWPDMKFTGGLVHASLPASACPLRMLTAGMRSCRRGRHAAQVGHSSLALHFRRTITSPPVTRQTCGGSASTASPPGTGWQPAICLQCKGFGHLTWDCKRRRMVPPSASGTSGAKEGRPR
ncbi:uncharacterized protein [Miscanthus floridulus]|uniref:uncharacterized protein n=1 Tax=Miscanthus floridulus TaxID=154761 RepID=UPI003458BEC4